MKFSTTTRRAIKITVISIAIIWAVYIFTLINSFSSIMIDVRMYGIIPRTLMGLIGIPLSPFIHASLPHIIGNTFALAVSMFLVYSLYPRKADELTFTVIILGGALVWLAARSGVHIGASGVIFGYAGFLIVAGFTGRRIVPFLTSIAIVLFYGGSLLSGLMPSQMVSWEGHLLGAVSGINYAWFTRKSNS
ncbi:rhomboid family intramembrane serine protease [Myxococcota bacterium]|nr:rhomboid family intramembrane serine protease [Myxococcota bacterium]MBU1381306.1 rhomboid family intramembrane serine protease [Myxococcota bacterium]MBU1498347.1 rhomboid family intramembrane serine protease [Myxococcota bacterium]